VRFERKPVVRTEYEAGASLAEVCLNEFQKAPPILQMLEDIYEEDEVEFSLVRKILEPTRKQVQIRADQFFMGGSTRFPPTRSFI